VKGRILTGRRVLAGGLAGLAVLMVASPCAAYTPPEVNPRIVVTTPQGKILIALAPENAPKHVEQFLIALEAGDFNGANVTRVAPKSYVQMTGGQGTALLSGLQIEHLKVGNLRGAFSVYDSGKPGDVPTLMLVLTRSPQLDTDYTPIGFVEAGRAVLQTIAHTPTVGDHQPADEITIIEMHVASAKERSTLRDAEVAVTSDDNGTALLAAVFIIACAAFVGALISSFHDRLGTQRVKSLGLLVALLTFFAVWVALGGTKAGSGLMGVALFGGAIAIFRLMGQFERPRQNASLGSVAEPRQFADRELCGERWIDEPDSDLKVGLGDRDTTAGGFGSS
jgi:cyclophilin family peptidyl-prolyl cis-trans isomerase